MRNQDKKGLAGAVAIIGIFVLAWIIVFTVNGWADYLGSYALAEYVIAPAMSVDANGNQVAPDSAEVIVFEEGVADNSYTYTAHGDTTVAWMSHITPENGSIDRWIFRDQAQDIDAGQLYGQYCMFLTLYANDEPYTVFHTFDVTATGEREVDMTSVSTSTNAANAMETQYTTSWNVAGNMIETDVSRISGDNTTADNLESWFDTWWDATSNRVGANVNGIDDTAAALLGRWIWANIDTTDVDSSGIGAWLTNNLYDAAVSAKTDTSIWQTQRNYDILNLDDWANHRFRYDDGELTFGVENPGDWAVTKANANSWYAGEGTYVEQGDSAIRLTSLDADTVTAYLAWPGAPKREYMSNMYFDVYLDTAYFIPVGFGAGRPAYGLDYLEIRFRQDTDESWTNYRYDRWYDSNLTVGWNRVGILYDSTTIVGDEDSCLIGGFFRQIAIMVKSKASDSSSVVLDNFVLNQRSRAKCVIRFDDGLKTQWENGWPIMYKYHFRGTYAVRQNNVVGEDADPGNTIYMGTTLLDSLYAQGNDIVNHGSSGLTWSGASEDSLRRLINGGQSFFISNGYSRGAGDVAWPSNVFDSLALSVVRERHIAGTGAIFDTRHDHVDFINDEGTMPLYTIPYVYINISDSTTWTPSLVNGVIDKCCALGNLLVLSFHNVSTTDSNSFSTNINTEDFDSIMGHLNNRRAVMDVTTWSEYRQHQKTIAAQLNTIQDYASEANDSLQAYDNYIASLETALAAVRDSVQYLTTYASLTSSGEDSISALVNKLTLQLDNDSLATLIAHAKAMRDSLQYCVTGSSDMTAAGEDSLSVLVNKLTLQLDNDSLATLFAALIQGEIAGDSQGTAIERIAWLCQQEYVDSAGLVNGTIDNLPLTASGEDSISTLVNKLTLQLDNDSLATLIGHAKAIRDSLQYCVTGSSSLTGAGEDSLSVLVNKLILQLDNDSLATLVEHAKAVRDSLQYCVSGSGSLTDAGEDSLSVMVNKIILQLDNDSLATLVAHAKAIRDSLQYCITGSGSLTAAGEDSLSVLTNKLTLQLDNDSLKTVILQNIAIQAQVDANGSAISALPTASAIVDNWETQSQADPTGFHVNVMEWTGNAVTASGGVPNVNLYTMGGGGDQSVTDLIDFADDGYDPAGDTVHTNIAAGGGSSSWGDTLRAIYVAFFDTTQGFTPDSSGTIFERLTWLAQNGVAGSDTVAILNAIDSLLRGSNGLNVARYETRADYKDGGSGSGAYPCSVLVYDGSHVRAGATVYVTVADSLYQVVTNSSGLSVFNLNDNDTGLTYLYYPPYIQDSNPDTIICTSSGGFDTLFCSGPTIISAPAGNYCVVYGWPRVDVGSALVGADVCIYGPENSILHDTSVAAGGYVYKDFYACDTTDSDGKFQISVPIPFYLGKSSATYDVVVTHSSLAEDIRMKINVPNASQAPLDSILAK